MQVLWRTSNGRPGKDTGKMGGGERCRDLLTTS